MPSWGFCCYENGEQAISGRMRDGVWEESPMGAGLRGEGRIQALETLLNSRAAQSSLPKDDVFLGALRDTALLASLDPGACLRCKIRADQQDLAAAAIADIYGRALPRLQFLPFAAGTEAPLGRGFRLLLLTDPPKRASEGAYVDFTAGQPSLRLNFPRLNFAQRTARALLPPLGLDLLLSMWNAAGCAAEERLGTEKAAVYSDLVAWLMLRRNFSAVDYPITGPEYEQLQKRVEEYEAAG